MNKPLTVIFCIPGKSFSGTFFKCWSNFILQCINNNIRPLLVQEYDPVVYYVRNKCLGGSVLRGKFQKPYNGEIDYDYILWIDSDIIFDFSHFAKLLNWNKQVVSGIYMMSDKTNYAAVLNWDIEYFGKNGTFKFLQEKDIQGVTDLIEVAYSGFGFMLVKRGVFESLEYPWFRPITHTLSADNKDIVDFSSEDSSMCYTLREHGYKIYVDPTVRVGHEKSFVV